MKRSVVPLVGALVAGVLLAVTPAALADGVIHRANTGGADVILVRPGGDANFSLSAVQHGDGTVTGQWVDTVFGRGVPAVSIHVDIDCLLVDGDDAWVSGVITRPAGLAGLPAITRVRDNGTSANDPPDQISFTFFPPAIDPAITCNDQPDLPLNDVNNGQVNVE